jgi:hypothetical protein
MRDTQGVGPSAAFFRVADLCEETEAGGVACRCRARPYPSSAPGLGAIALGVLVAPPKQERKVVRPTLHMPVALTRRIVERYRGCERWLGVDADPSDLVVEHQDSGAGRGTVDQPHF